VRIADTSIRDSTSAGVTLTNGARGVVTRLVAGGNTIGINVNGTVVAPTTVDVSDSTFERNNTGIYLLTPGSGNVARATVRGSSLIGGNYGLAAEADPGAVAWLTSSYNTVSNNVGAGIYNSGGRVRVSGNAITGNATGFWNVSGPFESAGNNMLGNNTSSDTLGTITLVGTQ
jgi:hypothetical protein